MNMRRDDMGYSTIVCLLAMLLISFGSPGHAAPENVGLPENFRDNFVLYTTVDKRDREPDVVRVMYIDPEAAAAAEPGSPLPEGTQIVMAEHDVVQGDGGKTQLTRDGRMIPTEQISTIFVAEKVAGIGEEYDESLRNGDWEFAVFLGDGSRKPDVDFDDCRECHRQAMRTDFTFSVFPNIDALKP